MVGLDGEKMSKSHGNLVFVSVLRRDGHDPMAVRLALLAHHYRGDWSWTADDLAAAETRLARWRDAVSRPTGPPPTVCWPSVRRHLADDLDAPGGAGRRRPLGRRRPSPAAARTTAAPDLVRRTVDALLGVRL